MKIRYFVSESHLDDGDRVSVVPTRDRRIHDSELYYVCVCDKVFPMKVD